MKKLSPKEILLAIFQSMYYCVKPECGRVRESHTRTEYMGTILLVYGPVTFTWMTGLNLSDVFVKFITDNFISCHLIYRHSYFNTTMYTIMGDFADVFFTTFLSSYHNFHVVKLIKTGS